MNLNFKNRIAFFYMVATAIIVLVVYAVVYLIMVRTVYNNLDTDLSYEAHKHTHEISILNDSIFFVNKGEWEEREHREAQVSPVFIQIMNSKGALMDKSPNLKDQELSFSLHHITGDHFDATLNQNMIRQVQIPMTRNGQIKGYILAAMSLESSLMVIRNLRKVLLISFPLVLIILFFTTRILAGRSISPVRGIINTANRITVNQLNERVELPQHKDELYQLSASINLLLQRIENALEREKQFTADASHELRNPLAALKGTLEVLIRKERAVPEYEAKIKTSLLEIDRMETIIEQLLILARLESGQKLVKEEVDITELIHTILAQYAAKIEEKHLHIHLEKDSEIPFKTSPYHASLILGNVISNAIKYSPENKEVRIAISGSNGSHSICIEDQGPGIPDEDLEQIFQPFYRSEQARNSKIKGNGLGLSIAQKSADLIGAHISISSSNAGVKCTILF